MRFPKPCDTEVRFLEQVTSAKITLMKVLKCLQQACKEQNEPKKLMKTCKMPLDCVELHKGLAYSHVLK